MQPSHHNPLSERAAARRQPPAGATLNILRALRSDRWDDATVEQLRLAAEATAEPSTARGRTRLFELPDAGHWVCASAAAPVVIGDDCWTCCCCLIVVSAAAAAAAAAAAPAPASQVHTDNPKGLIEMMLPSMVEAAATATDAGTSRR